MLYNRDGSAISVAPHHVLSTDRVRHVGAAVAFVIAETAAAAKDAAEKVIVGYEPLPAVTDALAAVEPGAPRLYDDLPNIMIDAEVGDAKATAEAFARAAYVTRLDTWINRVTGVPMEPRAAVGSYDAASGRYTLYAGSGGIVRQKKELSAILGVPFEWSASSPTKSAAILVRKTAFSPSSRSSPGARARLADRSSGPANATRPLSAITWAATSRCRPNSRSTPTAAFSR